jgi:hypothetical protein
MPILPLETHVNQQVDRQEEQIAHRSNATTSTILHKTARNILFGINSRITNWPPTPYARDRSPVSWMTWPPRKYCLASNTGRLEDSPMPPNPCRFCDHGNPADANFCSACGGQVNLLPCPRCGAVNDNVATACYHCERPLPGRAKELPDAAPPAATVSGPVSRPASRAIAGALVLAVMAALAYYAYTQFSVVAPVPPPTAGSGEGTRGGPAAAGAIGRNAVAGDVTPAKVDESVPPASPAAVPPEPAPAEPVPAAASPSRAGRRAAESGQTQPLSQEACTEATAALGLCAAKDASTPKARPQAEEARKAGGGQEPPRQQGCTEAATALGLCAP